MTQLTFILEDTPDDRGFSGRIQAATAFEKRLFEQIAAMGFQVAINGTEHTHPDFIEALRKSTDQTSLAIRFQPDAVACIGNVPRSFFVEAKAAKTIELLAYQQYTKLADNGNILAIVFEKIDWRWTFIEDLVLVSGQETVARFPPHKRFQVRNDWIYPRASQQWQNIQRFTPHASGTPYREVDVSSLSPWTLFYSHIIKRLGDCL